MPEASRLDPPLPATTIHQFPLPTWIENLAIRPNGTLLVTILTAPSLYLIDPSRSPATATLVHTFPGITALTGIVELQPDIFYVCGGNFDLATFKSEHGSYFLFEVNMTSFSRHGTAAVRTIMQVEGSGLLNGMEALSAQDGTVLIADSDLGGVWKVNTKTAAHEMVIHVDEMGIPAPPGLPMGINGVRIRGGYLYWTNTGRKQFCRVEIDGGGMAIGDVEVVAGGCLGDDFAFDGEGNAWIAQNVLNTIAVVKVGGEVVVVAGKRDELVVAGGTACRFGRREGEEHVLYVTTTGSLAEPINGSVVEGGKVVAVDTRRFY